MELLEFGTSFHSMEMEDTELWVELGSPDLEAEEQSLSLVSDASSGLLDELITTSTDSTPSPSIPSSPAAHHDQPASPTLYNNYLLYDNDNTALKELDLGLELELDWDWCGSSDSDYLLSNNDDPEPSMLLSDDVTELNFHSTQFNSITEVAEAEEDLQLQFNSILSSIPIPTLTTTGSSDNVDVSISVSNSSIVPDSVQVESPASVEVNNPGPSGSRASGSKSKTTGTGRNTSKKSGTRGQAKKKNGLDKVQRKKEQNKTAATRYREKKKIQAAVVLSAEAELDLANNELRTKKENLLREINIIKSCVRELVRAKKTSRISRK